MRIVYLILIVLFIVIVLLGVGLLVSTGLNVVVDIVFLGETLITLGSVGLTIVVYLITKDKE